VNFANIIKITPHKFNGGHGKVTAGDGNSNLIIFFWIVHQSVVLCLIYWYINNFQFKNSSHKNSRDCIWLN
jgi:hypothetical protein